MSVLIRFVPASRVTTEQYEEVRRRLEEAGHFPPEGMDYHVCFLSDDGSVRVSEIYDSREQLDAYGERLMPVLEEAGIDVGTPEILEIHNIVKR